MKLDKAGQAALLKLSEIDLEIAQIKYEIGQLIDLTQLVALQRELTESSGALLEARTNFENIQTSVKRAEEDIALVTARILRDRERLNATSSPKDAMGIQAELDSLAKRKSELEDVEIGLLEELEGANLALNQVNATREEITRNLEGLQSEIQANVDELKNRGRKLTADRAVVLGKVPEEVLTKYSALATRQVAVGQIVDRACSACRMTLTVGAIDSLSNLSEDELGNCPECQALIVR